VDGETTTLEPLKLPGCHKYVEAPAADKVVEFGQLMKRKVALEVTVGVVLTVMSRVVVAVQPFEAVPVMV
jgi:hypothetical protein